MGIDGTSDIIMGTQAVVFATYRGLYDVSPTSSKITTEIMSRRVGWGLAKEADGGGGG